MCVCELQFCLKQGIFNVLKVYEEAILMFFNILIFYAFFNVWYINLLIEGESHIYRNLFSGVILEIYNVKEFHL